MGQIEPIIQHETTAVNRATRALLSSLQPNGLRVSAAQQARWRNDPLLFCRDVYEEQPREVQPEVLTQIAQHDRVAWAATRDIGKSTTASYAAQWFLVSNPGAMVLTIAPRWRQVEESIWVEMERLWRRSRLPKLLPRWECQTTKLKTTQREWRALGFAADTSGGIEGPHGKPVLIISDESQEVPDSFYTSLLSGHTDMKFLAIGRGGNPLGWFHNCFTTERHRWKCITTSALDVPRLRGRAEAVRDELGEDNPVYRQQQLAEFTGGDDQAVIPLAAVQRAVDRVFTPGVTSWRRVLSLDPAGHGGDESVLTLRFGPVVLEQRAWSGLDEMQTVGRTVQAAAEHRAEMIIVDQPGLGSPIISRLREVLRDSKIRVYGFNPGARAHRHEHFANLKSERVGALRQLFMDNLISIPDDPKLIGQLVGWKYEITSRGQARSVDPANSPDRADSLLMAFAAEWITRPEWSTGAL